MFKYWRNKVIMGVQSARTKYHATSVCKLKQGNSSKWWKEVNSIGGLSSRDSWHHQLLSSDNPTCQHLVESINTFFTSLTSHLSPLEPERNRMSLPPSWWTQVRFIKPYVRSNLTNLMALT